jgi:hypothetical protein
MRTTLTLDDDIYERCREVARIRQISLGEALSELARRGMGTPEVKLSSVTGLPVISVPGRIVTGDVVRLQDEEGLER